MPSVATLNKQPQVEETNTGLDKAYRKKMADSLSDILAATYHLTIKSHVYHWNVVGPVFKSIHELTEEHYQALFEAADVIAERIRALGHLAPVKLSGAAKFAPSAGDVDHRSAHDMVQDLIEDHAAAVRAMREAVILAGDEHDVVTEDMLTQHLNFHEKALWMLRAILTD